jgi:anaerobic selenocysteine-containing dehydrogenase
MHVPAGRRAGLEFVEKLLMRTSLGNIWNSNPAVTMPNQNLVRQGLRREDLFTAVVEHTMTDTAMLADYVLPATTQLEH